MTKIKKISINTVIDAHDLKVISNYVERVKLEPIEVTNFRWIHGIDHQVIIGRKKYIITLRYNKLRTEIEKMSFKVTEIIPEFDQLLIGDPDRNIDPNKPMRNDEDNPKVGMKVKELATGRIARITGVYDNDNEVWMVSGHDVGVFMLSEFWNFFEEVSS